MTGAQKLERRVLTVSSGMGPVEVRQFVALLAERLEQMACEHGVLVEGVVVHGEDDAPRSVDLHLAGGVGALEPWVGTHVLVARSERRGRRARKRWFVGVSLAEARPPGAQVSLDLRDIEIDCCRASGPGGQHLQKTASAVRVLHRPTGISVRVQTERSQHRNRAVALEKLAAILSGRAAREAGEWVGTRRGRCLKVVRGEAVATWTLRDEVLGQVTDRGRWCAVLTTGGRLSCM